MKKYEILKKYSKTCKGAECSEYWYRKYFFTSENYKIAIRELKKAGYWIEKGDNSLTLSDKNIYENLFD